MAALAPCRAAGEVADLMTPNPITVSPETPIREVWQIMADRRFRHMPVVNEDGSLQGIISQRDLLSAARAGDERFGWDSDRPVSEVMHKEVDTIRTQCCAGEAARHMLRTKRSCLPVVDEGHKIMGILTEADYLRSFTRGSPPCTCQGIDHGSR